MNNEIKLTVFTPTYNRATKLKKCYEELVNQSLLDFIWLIIDDGSTDNTKEMVKQWTREAPFRIEYIYQSNAGKQRAVNTAINNCRTNYFAFLDSDDYFCENTVERIYELLPNIDNDDTVAGIVARRGDENRKVVIELDLNEREYITNMDSLYKKYGDIGETFRVYKLSVLIKFLYPVIDDKFILESYMLGQIDQAYNVLFVDDVFSISKYYSDGYTLNAYKLYHNNPYGYLLGIAVQTNSKRGIVRKIKFMTTFINWKKLKKIKWNREIKINKAIWLLAYPLAFCLRSIKYPKWFFDK